MLRSGSHPDTYGNRPLLIPLMLVGLLLAVALPVSARADDLENYLNAIREEFQLPALAAAVVRHGDVVAAAAVGTRILGKDIPVAIDDRFHIGSNTKSMTATLAGMMVDEEKLRWDSRVGDVLGDEIHGMNADLANATLEQLLSHASGIPADNDAIVDLFFTADAFEYDLVDLRLHILDRWKTSALVIPEGSRFQYSNLGYVIAGSMIEKVSGTPWEQMMHERIFEPLGMHTAGLGPQATYGLIDAPVGHRIDDGGTITPMRWGPAADIPQVMAPAGNAHMSILDYTKWAAWNAAEGKRGPALVKPETLRYIHTLKLQTPIRKDPPAGTPVSGGYALGWGLVTFDWAGKPLLSHNGSNSMNLAKIVLDSELDLAVVVTTNFPGAAADAAAGKVLEHLYTLYRGKS